jgi:hypothetical protein
MNLQSDTLIGADISGALAITPAEPKQGSWRQLDVQVPLLARSGRGANFRFIQEHRKFLSVNEFHYLTHKRHSAIPFL